MIRIPFFFLSIFSFLLCISPAHGQYDKKKKLNVISSLFVNNKEVPLGDDSLLTNYFRIEPVNKAIFKSKQKTAVEFMDRDSSGIKKKNDTLRLPIRKGYKVLVDKSPFDESKQEYTYIGKIRFLGVYVVGGLYWETLDYKFIDTITGKEVQSFGSLPLVSPNKKNIITIYADPYDTDADVELYQLVNGKPRNILRVSFMNWMPAVEKVNMFWSSDGHLYVPVLSPEKYWKPDGNLNDEYEYIRITVL